MTGAVLLVVVVKVLIVIGFLMNMAAISVWADRRQSAMVQDRVGPNRAVVYLSANVARGLMVLPALLLAGLVAIPAWGVAHPVRQFGSMTGSLHLGVAVAWICLLLLSSNVHRHGYDNGFDKAVARLRPASYFYAGLVLHLALFFVLKLIPTSAYTVEVADQTVFIGPGLAASLAAIVIILSGIYAAAKVPSGKVALRLAGTLHAVADAIKLIWKEDLRPKNADKLLYGLAPLLAMFPALVTFAVLPFGNKLCFVDKGTRGELDFGDLLNLAYTVPRSGVCGNGQISVNLAVADLNVGLLYIFAIAGTGIIGAALAGWASDNKFALLGGLRATSQMVSYEVAMGLSIVGMLMITGTVHMQKIVQWQGENAWGIFVQPFAFFLFLTAVVAETKRVPFDQPEGESEIVAGYFLEYSGMKFGLFFLGEYAEFVFSSALITTLFFGGYQLPFLHPDGLHVVLGGSTIYELKMTHFAVSLTQVLTFFGKTILVAWLHVFIRWTLPRFRYDQLMKLGWTKLLPLSIANIMLTGVVILGLQSAGAGTQAVIKLVADLTQAAVAVGGFVALIALVLWLLEPTKRKRLFNSSAARYARAAGGIKASEMQA
jgi:NADH-quinone oxidoreductase subunit H